MRSGNQTHLPQIQSQKSSETNSHKQIGVPHLIRHLTQEYARFMTRVNQHYVENGMPTAANIEKQIRLAKPLLDFFEEYLDKFRPTRMFPVDANYGFVLSNNAQFMLCPPIEENDGVMQSGSAVAVTQGLSNVGQGGMQDSEAISII